MMANASCSLSETPGQLEGESKATVDSLGLHNNPHIDADFLAMKVFTTMYLMVFLI